MSNPRLVCLLPARNAAADLPGFFDSAARFADAVVALDDGSTDDTADLLAAHPLVSTLLRNPRRPDYRGWDDAANRNQLLAAAAPLAPDWIISVDADERIDADDARALRDFLATDALPGIAYGFRCYPMYGDLVHYVPTPIWVYRLFAYAPGQTFPHRALHFAPVPTSIPRRAFVRTTLRIQHLGGLTREHRVARYEKYREADPDRAYWPDYTPLLTEPDAGKVNIWQPRSADHAVLGPTDDEPSAVDDVRQPQDGVLTVVVLGDGPADAILRAVHAARAAATGARVEVALAAPSTAAVLAMVATAMPEVLRIPYDPIARDARRAAIKTVTGGFVLMFPPSMQPAPGAFAAMLEAHQRGYAMAAGTVLDGARRWQERADFLLAYGGAGFHPGVIEGAPAFCSHPRELLDDPAFDGLDGAGVNRLLARQGYLAYRAPESRFTYRDADITMPALLARAYLRGVSEGNYLVATGRERGDVIGRGLFRERRLVDVPRRIARHAAQSDDLRTTLLAGAGEVAKILGIVASFAHPAPGKLSVLLGRPVGTLLVAAADSERGECSALSLVRFELVAGEIHEAELRPSVVIPTGDGGSSVLTADLGLDRPGTATPTRFAIDDVFARRFGIAVDDYLLLDRALTESNADSPLRVFQSLGTTWRWPHLVTALRRETLRTSLPAVALLLLCWELRRIEPGTWTHESLDQHENEAFSEFAARVRAVVAPPAPARQRTPRDALKLVEWA